MIDAPPTSPAIEAIGLTKTFGKQRAVDALDLTIPTGQVFGFIGPNGAGKSTTIKILMDLLPASGGTVKVLGLDVRRNRAELRQRVGYVPEQHFIPRWMRVREAIRFCRSFYRTWNDDLCSRLMDLLELPGKKKVKQLSKGMLAKLALLLAVSYEPELLILDEPMSGLDPLVREDFMEGVLRTAAGKNQSVLFSSHTLGDVERMADSVGIICQGRILIHCSIEDLLQQTKRIRVTLTNGQEPPPLPEGTIRHRLERREWTLTVNGNVDSAVQNLQAAEKVAHVEVLDIGLEDIFKDYIRGRRAMA